MLREDVPELADQPMRILDAGGGSGHMAVRLAGLGHSVVLCDISEEMLAKAAMRAAEAGVAEAIDIRHLSIQGYANIADERFDLVLCHAVLEWLDDPKSVVGDLARLVKQGGHLSVMFYNRFASLSSEPSPVTSKLPSRTIGPARSGAGGEKARPPWTTKRWSRGSKTTNWK